MPGKIQKRGGAKKKAKGTSGSKKKRLRISSRKTISDKALSDLKESELQLKIVLEAARMGIWEWYIGTNVVHWSSSVLEIFGIPRRQFANRFEAYMSLVYPDDRPRVNQALKDTLEHHKPYYIEHRIIRHDGSMRWLEAYGNVLRDKHGRPAKMTGTVQDITEKRAAEKEIQDWKMRHDLITSSVGIVIYDYNISSGKVIWSDTCEKVLGYEPSELANIGRLIDLIHDEDRADALMRLQEAQKSLSSYDVYYRFSTKTESYRHLHHRGTFIPDATGKAVRMLGMMNDVTERIVSQQRLEESEYRFRTLQQASFGGIGLHDQGTILDCNNGLVELTGYTREELIGCNGLELIAPEWRDFVIEKIRSGYDKTYDVEGIKKDGTRYSAEIRGKNIPYGGRTIRVTEFRDITERKRSEEKIIEQNTRLLAVAEDLKRKNNQLEEFTQIVSHNLRSPVGNIVTLLGFAENATSDQEGDQYFALLKQAAATTLTMLNELNEVLKIKQNKNIEKQQLSFEHVYQQMTSMFRARISELGAEVTGDFSEAPTLLYPVIYLESIFLNLLDNALKYHSPGRKPRIHFRTSTTSAGEIILEVTDNGLGINLERFGHQVFKLRKTFHHHPESRGIGLFMTKNQVEAMGGEISISSKQNAGTSFFINFNKHQSDDS